MGFIVRRGRLDTPRIEQSALVQIEIEGRTCHLRFDNLCDVKHATIADNHFAALSGSCEIAFDEKPAVYGNRLRTDGSCAKRAVLPGGHGEIGSGGSRGGNGHRERGDVAICGYGERIGVAAGCRGARPRNGSERGGGRRRGPQDRVGSGRSHRVGAGGVGSIQRDLRVGRERERAGDGQCIGRR